MIKQFLSIHSSTSVQLNAKLDSRQGCFPLHCTLDWPHVGKVFSFSTICDLVPVQSCGHCNHCNHCNLCNHRGGSLLGVTATCLAGLTISSRRRCSSCSQAVLPSICLIILSSKHLISHIIMGNGNMWGFLQRRNILALASSVCVTNALCSVCFKTFIINHYVRIDNTRYIAYNSTFYYNYNYILQFR